jgi:sec-independent protein translocase protein TatC
MAASTKADNQAPIQRSDPTVTTSLDKPEASKKKPFLEHLEDLRRALLWSLISLAVGIGIAVPLAPRILQWLMVPLKQAGVADPGKFLKVLSVSGGFSVAMKIMLWSGVLIALPGIVAAVGAFVFPGLTRKERKAVLSASGFAVILFVGGVWVGYYPTLPFALQWFFQLNSWLGVSCDFVDLSDYIRFALQLLICFGLGFELPLLILVLGYIGIIKSDMLRKYRRHAIIVLLFIAAAITPGPDPVSMTVVATPMIILYEICVWLIWAKEKARRSETGS